MLQSIQLIYIYIIYNLYIYEHLNTTGYQRRVLKFMFDDVSGQNSKFPNFDHNLDNSKRHKTDKNTVQQVTGLLTRLTPTRRYCQENH